MLVLLLIKYERTRSDHAKTTEKKFDAGITETIGNRVLLKRATTASTRETDENEEGTRDDRVRENANYSAFTIALLLADIC